MSDTVIRVENLSKKYVLSHQQDGKKYKALRDVVAEQAKSVSQKLLKPSKATVNPSREEFWALKDVSFEIKQGDRVGIIGRNGAGKSTLLKVLSRIVEPTSGRIGIRGRVASLLEVGTGFHPELTGRENVYLNGAILGMGKAEITRKFDEIVAFAEVEKFLDTPVKRYSSGMYVRLAFAVAAHLEPEVLIVDEVLAVGDVQFQKKCLGKMEDVGREGRTVLFVSHNLAAVERLCTRGIVLQQGKVQYVGNQTDASTQYLTSNDNVSLSLLERNDRKGTGELKVCRIEVRDLEGNVLDAASSGQGIDVYFYYEKQSLIEISKIQVSLSISTQSEIPVFLLHNRLTGDDFGSLPDQGCFVCRIARLPLPASTYKISYSIMPNYGKDGTFIDLLSNAEDLTVLEGDFYGSGEVPPISHGVCLVNANWRIEAEQRSKAAAERRKQQI